MWIGQNLKRYFFPPKFFAKLYSIENVCPNSELFSVSVLESFLFLSSFLLDVPFFKDSDNRHFETLLKAASLILPCTQPLLLYPHVRVLLTALRQMNREHNHFKDPVLLEQLKPMLSELLF